MERNVRINYRQQLPFLNVTAIVIMFFYGIYRIITLAAYLFIISRGFCRIIINVVKVYKT